MSRDQQILDGAFRGLEFGARGGLIDRGWHTQCNGEYAVAVMNWKSEARGGGPDQFPYCIYAGTGSGKTHASGYVASFLLNGGDIDQVVVVCPNRSIRRKTAKVYHRHFGIDLVGFNSRKHVDGIPRTKNGYILTYAHLNNNPELHRKICSPKTLVIFDEVHHLGDKTGWGDAAVRAFGGVRFVLCLTGTPYRSDNKPIPFVRYEETERNGIWRFKPDFTYSLGQAVAEGICREPMFVWHDAEVLIRTGTKSGETTVTFKDTDVTPLVDSLRMRGAVRYGSAGRKAMLKKALDECRAEGRKVIVFLGGDTDGDSTPTMDATELLPSELRELGITDDEFDVVTGDDKGAQEKIEKFGASSKWILVSINMVSEGTDIPELSAAIFLTTVTAKQTTGQRIGRVLRLMGEGDRYKVAIIYMFEDPGLVEYHRELKKEIDQERAVYNARKKAESNGQPGNVAHARAEAVCVGGGNVTMVSLGDKMCPASFVDEARRRLRARNLSDSLVSAMLELMIHDDEGKNVA